MKILIIDDDVLIRGLVRIWLEREGFEVFEAENGLKGVQAHISRPVDLVICDLIMPVQEGIETITQFREEFPDVGIIAISGGGKIGPDSYLAVAAQLGAWKVFAKPLNMPSLTQAIREWRLPENSK
jgi:DNA-binding response OmpR family regulator